MTRPVSIDRAGTKLQAGAPMDSRLKQRLIGAAVLWLLAFIFLPPLLHSSSGQKTVQKSISMPAPGQTQQTRSIVLDHSGGDQAATGHGQAQPSAAADHAAGPSAAPAPPAGAAGKTTPAARPKRQSAGGGSGESGPHGSNAATGGSGGSSGAKAAASGKWAVQVGSFSKKSNALDLRKRLRDRQYPVMVIPFRLEGETLYRVRVGPRPSKQAATRLKAELSQRMGLDGRVVSQDQ